MNAKMTDQINLAWFKEFLLSTQSRIDDLPQEEALPFLEEKTRELLNADDSHFLFFEKEKKCYSVPALGKELPPCDKKEESITREAVEKKQPLLVQDVHKSLLYNEKRDNILGVDLLDLLIVPISPGDSVDGSPPFLSWACVRPGDGKRIQQKRVLFLMKFMNAMTPYLLSLRHENVSLQEVTLSQCLKSNEMLEHRMERNKQYFHSIVHDIRTPMNALLGFLELLENNEEDISKKEYLNSALKSGEQMVRLISDALEVAKIEKGELPVEKKPFSLIREMPDTIKIFYETARKKRVSLACFMDPALPSPIVSDAYRIKQVLSNLLSNAIKFTPEHGSVYVEFLYDAKRDVLTVSVEDTGPGIPKEQLANIFLPYRQENSSTERKFGGTGLGLSISQQIVALLGGKLELDSEVGRGSRFSFAIPANTPDDASPSFDIGKLEGKRVHLYRWKKRKDLRAVTMIKYLKAFGIDLSKGDPHESISDLLAERDFDTLVIEHDAIGEEKELVQRFLDDGGIVLWLEDVFDLESQRYKGHIAKVSYPILPMEIYSDLVEAKKKIEKKRPSQIDLSGHRVLVVDDNRINLKLMEEVLKKYRLEYALSEDAETALKLTEESPYDLIFMDENMPKMLGSEAIRILREKIAKHQLPDMAIISLSGDSHHKEKILEAGADFVMTKPIRLDQLQDVFLKYLH